MKNTGIKVLGLVALSSVAVVIGCSPKSESVTSKPAGARERADAALNKAAEKTAEVATNVAEKTAAGVKEAAEATKDAAGKVVEKTGEGLQKAGTAVENAGADMQK